MSAQPISAGFADPVDDAQRTFRALLEAMARPGMTVPVAGVDTSPDGVSGVAAATVLALADYSTPLWLSAPLLAGEFASFAAFHTGAPITDDPARAAFALFAGDDGDVDITAFHIGTPEYPDRSTTVIVDVEDFVHAPMRLTGPGVETETAFGPGPLADVFWAGLCRNAEAFPLGIDAVFTAPGMLAAVPRSIRIED